MEHIRFAEHLVMAGFRYAYGISAADITGNGTLDLVAADTDAGLYWFEDDGKGNFSQRTGERLKRHAIADINNDGRPEIVIVDNINRSLLWFEYSSDHYSGRELRPPGFPLGGLFFLRADATQTPVPEHTARA